MPLDMRIEGHGEPVVFFHGCPTVPDELAPIAHAVATNHMAVQVALPGYGTSPELAPPWAMTELHEALEAALLERGLRRVAIVGYSGGAFHALALAVRRNVEVTLMVSLAGLTSIADEERQPYRDLAGAVAAGTLDVRTIAVDRFLSPAYRTQPAAVAHVLGWADATSPQNLAAELLAFANADNFTAGVRELEIPIVARVGSADGAVGVTKAQELVNAARHGTLELVEGKGHALMVEDQAGTVASVLRALASRGLSTDTAR
ncbi:MAG TPA: alpha/beta hydrolase [Polyangiaceae bacterium]